MLPTDLKDFHAPLGAFQKLDGDACVMALTALLILCAILPEILR